MGVFEREHGLALPLAVFVVEAGDDYNMIVESSLTEYGAISCCAAFQPGSA